MVIDYRKGLYFMKKTYETEFLCKDTKNLVTVTENFMKDSLGHEHMTHTCRTPENCILKNKCEYSTAPKDITQKQIRPTLLELS